MRGHQALATERSRRWTAAETTVFTERLLQLAGELGPPWHLELAGIADLARPLAHPDSTLSMALEHGTEDVLGLFRQQLLVADQEPSPVPDDRTATDVIREGLWRRWVEEQELEHDGDGWELP